MGITRVLGRRSTEILIKPAHRLFAIRMGDLGRWPSPHIHQKDSAPTIGDFTATILDTHTHMAKERFFHDNIAKLQRLTRFFMLVKGFYFQNADIAFQNALRSYLMSPHHLMSTGTWRSRSSLA